MGAGMLSTHVPCDARRAELLCPIRDQPRRQIPCLSRGRMFSNLTPLRMSSSTRWKRRHYQATQTRGRASGIRAASFERPLTVRQKLWRIGGLLLTLALVALLFFGQQISSFAANAWMESFPRPQATPCRRVWRMACGRRRAVNSPSWATRGSAERPVISQAC